MSWKDELSILEQEAELADVDRFTRREAIWMQFLDEEVRPVLESTARELQDRGFAATLNPSEAGMAPDRVMLEVRSGSQSARVARSPTAFRVRISPEAAMVIDYWKPFNDEDQISTPFGFLSGDRLREALRVFLRDNDLLQG